MPRARREPCASPEPASPRVYTRTTAERSQSVARCAAEPAHPDVPEASRPPPLLAQVAPELGDRHVVREIAGDVVDLLGLAVMRLGHESYTHCTTVLHNWVRLDACSIRPLRGHSSSVGARPEA